MNFAGYTALFIIDFIKHAKLCTKETPQKDSFVWFGQTVVFIRRVFKQVCLFVWRCTPNYVDNKQVQASILLYYTRFNSSAFCVSKCRPKANDNRKCVRVFYIEKSVYTLTRINPYELMYIFNAKVKWTQLGTLPSEPG